MRKLGFISLVSFVILLVYANWPIDALPPKVKITSIEISKHDRTLILYSGSTILKTYLVSLGRSPLGAKVQEGDNKTPEGDYTIEKIKNDSAFHLALKISYPTPAQVESARTRGVKPGSDIMIHGIRNGLGFLGRLHRCLDWTAGCIALTNLEIEQIAAISFVGLPVRIVP